MAQITVLSAFVKICDDDFSLLQLGDQTRQVVNKLTLEADYFIGGKPLAGFSPPRPESRLLASYTLNEDSSHPSNGSNRLSVSLLSTLNKYIHFK